MYLTVEKVSACFVTVAWPVKLYILSRDALRWHYKEIVPFETIWWLITDQSLQVSLVLDHLFCQLKWQTNSAGRQLVAITVTCNMLHNAISLKCKTIQILSYLHKYTVGQI